MLPLSQAISGAAALCHCYKNSNQMEASRRRNTGNIFTKTKLHAKREAGVGGGAYQAEYTSPVTSNTDSSELCTSVACGTVNQRRPNDKHAEAERDQIERARSNCG
jgi:hypothetical protein